MRSLSSSATSAHARGVALAVIAIWLAPPTHASGDAPALGVDEAVAIALAGQPLLTGVAARAQAARESSVAAAALPDPSLFAGVEDLPTQGDEAYTFSDQSDTKLVVGIAQQFPGPGKRRLRRLEQTRAAEQFDLERARLARVVRRDAARAWLDAWDASRSIDLVRAQRDASALEADAVAVAREAARATLADVLTAEIERERLTDAVAAREQALIRARSALGRWVGAAAGRAVAPELPATSCEHGAAALLAALPGHPEIAVLDAGIARAHVARDLAAADRRPDWNVELGYGHLRTSPDMVMMRVGVGLPLFPGDRQDRRTASARLLTEAAEAERDDALRRLAADAERTCAEAAQLDARLDHFDSTLLPKANAAIDAALSNWRQGRGELASVLAARRGALDVALERLSIEVERAALAIEVDYLTAAGDVP